MLVSHVKGKSSAAGDLHPPLILAGISNEVGTLVAGEHDSI